MHISIHAPRTGSDARARRSKRPHAISIHAPRTGSDPADACRALDVYDFNPRSPHGERPCDKAQYRDFGHFNPRSPHGERQHTQEWACPRRYFNPRSPHGERRHRRNKLLSPPAISIHAPRTGSDENAIPDITDVLAFQSTLPARGATTPPTSPMAQSRDFNPRSPHGERQGQTQVRLIR